MQDDFITCQHCATINFKRESNCTICKYLLPRSEDGDFRNSRKKISHPLIMLLIIITFLICILV
jgi:hypothetical protein